MDENLSLFLSHGRFKVEEGSPESLSIAITHIEKTRSRIQILLYLSNSADMLLNGEMPLHSLVPKSAIDDPVRNKTAYQKPNQTRDVPRQDAVK